MQALLFTLIRQGLSPRIATERADAGETRLDKIRALIEASKLSIHDLSRCQSREAGEYSRLNMPFELGIDFGCRAFSSKHSNKSTLILEEKPYRYQAALSDIAGSDIEFHGGNYRNAVRRVAHWLSSIGAAEEVGPALILSEYEDFQAWHYDRQIELGHDEEDIQQYPTPLLLSSMAEWVAQNRPRV